MQKMPARLAARMPLGESSNAIASLAVYVEFLQREQYSA